MEILEIAIVGTALSFLIQFIKGLFGTESNTTKWLTLLLSVILGAGIFFFSGTAFWQASIGVLAAASTVYAFLLE